MKKTTKTKSSKKNSLVQPSTISAEQDIVGLITTLVQKLVSLETKIDTVLSRILERNIELPKQQLPLVTNVTTKPNQNFNLSSNSSPSSSSSVFSQQNKNIRPMFKVICADCKKNCEVPFKPSNGRAVYCKECFTKRKTNRNFIPKVEEKPREVLLVQQPISKKTQAVKPAVVSIVKKQPVAKMPKKKSVKKNKK